MKLYNLRYLDSFSSISGFRHLTRVQVTFAWVREEIKKKQTFFQRGQNRSMKRSGEQNSSIRTDCDWNEIAVLWNTKLTLFFSVRVFVLRIFKQGLPPGTKSFVPS